MPRKQLSDNMQSFLDQQSKLSAVPVANTGRLPGIFRPRTSARVETAVADSTSVISARSYISTRKRKSAEEERNELKKRKLEKKEVNDRHKHRDTHDRLKNRDLRDRLKNRDLRDRLRNRDTHDRLKHKDTPAVTPLMDIVVPDVTPIMDIGSPAVTPLMDLVPRRTGVMYYCASATINFSNICHLSTLEPIKQYTLIFPNNFDKCEPYFNSSFTVAVTDELQRTLV